MMENEYFENSDSEIETKPNILFEAIDVEEHLLGEEIEASNMPIAPIVSSQPTINNPQLLSNQKFLVVDPKNNRIIPNLMLPATIQTSPGEEIEASNRMKTGPIISSQQTIPITINNPQLLSNETFMLVNPTNQRIIPNLMLPARINPVVVPNAVLQQNDSEQVGTPNKYLKERIYTLDPGIPGPSTSHGTKRVEILEQFVKNTSKRSLPHPKAKKGVFDCLVKSCHNNSLSAAPGVKFFKLPTDSSRRLKWCKIMRHFKNIDANKIQNIRVCSDHFRRQDIYYKKSMKLFDHAIPSPVVASLRAKQKRNETQYIRTVDETEAMKKIKNLMKHHKPPVDIRRDSREFKYFAYNLHIGSPIAYKFLEPLFKLPAQKSLMQMSLQVPAGTDQRTINALAAKLRCLPEEARYCALCYGTMKLSRGLYYNVTRDCIIGLESVGEVASDVIATRAHVIMLRGLKIPWEQLIGYGFTGDDSTLLTDTWIKKTIELFLKEGVQIMAVVSKEKHDFMQPAVTLQKPFHIVDNNIKIHHVNDVSGLLADLYEYVYNNTLMYNEEVVNFNHVQQLYDLMKLSSYNLIPGVKREHVHPSPEQQRSSAMAKKVFSAEVAAAMHHFTDNGVLPAVARTTANFIGEVGDLYHMLDSSPTSNKPFTFSYNQLETFERIKIFFGKLREQNPPNSNGPTENSCRLNEICTALKISIDSILLVAYQLQGCGVEKFYTRRLQTRPLVAAMRRISELSPSSPPTPIAFVRAFSKVYFKNFLDHSSLACKNVPYKELLYDVRKCNFVPIPEPNIDKLRLPFPPDYHCELPKENQIMFVISYLVSRILDLHSCAPMSQYFDKAAVTGKNLAVLKEESSFKSFNIHDQFEVYVIQLESHFLSDISKNPGARSIGERLKLALYQIPFNIPCSCFPKELLVKLFIRLRLYHTLRHNNSETSSSTFTVPPLIMF